MYSITVRAEFNSAHRLRGCKGKCESLHGHNWVVEATVSARKIDKVGMLVDFNVLKKELSEFLEQLDHKYLNELKPFKKVNPTSENIAKYICEGISKKNKIKPLKVTVWETPTSGASYEE